ncbi:hypothetical protein T11_15859, partial [Trichinella zimbabwensis]
MAEVNDQELDDDIEKTYDAPISSMPEFLVMELPNNKADKIVDVVATPHEVNDERKTYSLSALQTKLLKKH